MRKIWKRLLLGVIAAAACCLCVFAAACGGDGGSSSEGYSIKLVYADGSAVNPDDIKSEEDATPQAQWCLSSGNCYSPVALSSDGKATLSTMELGDPNHLQINYVNTDDYTYSVNGVTLAAAGGIVSDVPLSGKGEVTVTVTPVA